MAKRPDSEDQSAPPAYGVEQLSALNDKVEALAKGLAELTDLVHKHIGDVNQTIAKAAKGGMLAPEAQAVVERLDRLEKAVAHFVG